MKLKLKRNGDGTLTGKTARRHNYKNEKALGRSAVDRMVEANAVTSLTKNNFHKKLGGVVKEPKYRRKSNHLAAYEDEMAFEDELWEEEQA